MTPSSPTPPDPVDPANAPWWSPLARSALALWILILGLLALRLLWQYFSPYTLIEDEAHYWEWSRRLDWSYYSKGPGVAWIIRAATELLGTSEFAIRAPAAASAAVGAWAAAMIARDHFDDRRLAFLSALLFACVPGFAVAAMIMTIDAPYIACWALAALFALRALLKGRQSAWVLFGLAIALGFLFKYTILLLIPGVLLAALLTRGSRPRLRPVPLLLAAVAAALGLVPVLVWNAHHDYATLRHLLGHLGAPGGDTQPTAAYHAQPWTILWMLEYIVLQILVGGPVVILAVFAFLNARARASRQTRLVINALLALALPILVFYFLVSLVAQTEGNWAMGGFVTLIPAAAWAIIDGVARRDHPVKFFWGAALFMGASILLFFPGATWLSRRALVGGYIPISRMTGMRAHARHAQRLIDELREETGREPLVMSEHYGRASLLAFYLEGHPTVYCTSAQVGGRKTQYDEWKETDLSDPNTLAPLLGRPGLLFGGRPDQWSCAFDALTDIGPLDMEPKHDKTTFTGLDFHTFESWTPPDRADEHPQRP